jgi:hypothetical protein
MSPDLRIEILVQQKSLILFFLHKGIAVVTWYVLLTTRNKYIHVCLTSLKGLCTESIGTSTIQCHSFFTAGYVEKIFKLAVKF